MFHVIVESMIQTKRGEEFLIDIDGAFSTYIKVKTFFNLWFILMSKLFNLLFIKYQKKMISNICKLERKIQVITKKIF